MSKFYPGPDDEPDTIDSATADVSPPSPDLTEAEIDALMMSPISDEDVAAIFQPEPEIETISIGELLLLNIETRIGRIADALETANKIDRNNFEALTAGVNRLADAFEQMAGTLACITESVESDADGVTRCYIRTRDDNHGFFLSQRNGD
jgi:hypothetical protein